MNKKNKTIIVLLSVVVVYFLYLFSVYSKISKLVDVNREEITFLSSFIPIVCKVHENEALLGRINEPVNEIIKICENLNGSNSKLNDIGRLQRLFLGLDKPLDTLTPVLNDIESFTRNLKTYNKESEKLRDDLIFFASNFTAAAENANKAIEEFEADNNISGAGMAALFLKNAYDIRSKVKEIEENIQKGNIHKEPAILYLRSLKNSMTDLLEKVEDRFDDFYLIPNFIERQITSLCLSNMLGSKYIEANNCLKKHEMIAISSYLIDFGLMPRYGIVKKDAKFRELCYFKGDTNLVLKKGARVEIIKSIRCTEGYKVKYGNIEGYIHKSLIEITLF